MSGANSSSITAAAAVASSTTTTTTTSFGQKKCLNPDCTDLKSRKGWRLRSGEYADLCDRCASAYEEGRFCESFHSDQSGWRSCNSCGKGVHCGCIVSFYCFVLLDDGGIDCISCARKKFFLTSNPALPPPVFYQVPLFERLKDISGKGWNQLAGSGPVPWHQAPSLFNSSIAHPESHPRLLYDTDRLHLSEKFSVRSLEKEKIEDISQILMNGSLKLGTRDMLENGVAGTNNEEQSSLSLNIANHSSSIRDDPSSPCIGMAILSSNGASETPLRTIPSASVMKQFHGNFQNGVDSAADVHIRGRPRADARGKSPLLPRYWPRFTDVELQQISGNSNSVITPLFEKMLSASDAGRIGRLVLPKKCAEAYFPPISQPDGLPLKVQDAKGKDWVFQFRFWPNNNSRMYVLEGVTPCIQSMQLQAGDIVTFSRLEPEGKLVMGFRKASGAPAVDQENDTSKARNSASANGDVELADSTPWSKVDKSGYIAKDVESKSPIKKRKSSLLGTKSKRFRIDSDDMIELKLTWEEAQGLIRPPPDHIPSIVVIEGFEFEEYEDAPIIGKPTILTTDNKGNKIQWVQCEACFKWRKIPADALLPSKWMCSSNSWDPERSFCSVAQELTVDQLEDLLPFCNSGASSKKLKADKPEVDSVDSLEGLETLANLAILGEGEAFSGSSQVTTKHPRHRSGCSCIVCIQPPSGKGPKHKQTCTCILCLTVKRRFKTLKMKREKKQSERDAETSEKKPQEHLPEKLLDDELLPSSNAENCTATNEVAVLESSDEDLYKRRSSELPFKGQIDLNIQPEREEELSPGYDCGSMMRILQDATERQQKSSNIDGDNNTERHQMVDGTRTGETVGICFTFSSSNNETGGRNPTASSMKSPASEPETENN